MIKFKKPQLINNKLDLNWWNNLPISERNEYEVYTSDLPEEKDDALEIIIKPEALDLSNLETSNHQTLWRPSNFNEYIGQQRAKQILNGYINGTKALKTTFPHLLIDGHAGTGKTTLAYLLAKQLNVPFVECVATTISSQQQLVDKIIECKGGILFIDEIHMINKKIANFILPILEDFQISGQKIRHFTLFGATTEKGILLKKFKPFVTRMKIPITLEPYTINELITLVKQYKNKTFPTQTIPENIYTEIAKNCRGTPRIAIRYLESYIFMGVDIQTVFKNYGIVKDGITETDIKILKILNEKEKGIGLKSLCAFLATSEENYLYSIENYLLEQGLITITNKRVITEKGKQFLNSIKK